MSDEFIPLSDIAEIVGGYAFKSPDFGAVGFPVVKIASIEPPRVNLQTGERIPPEKVVGLDRFRLNNRDIVMAMTGATIGKVGRIRSGQPAYLNQRVAKIYAKAGREFDDFVFALVSQAGFDAEVINNSNGSAQANISTDGIGRILVPDLSPAEQLQIGRIIAALDDKIELNRRMNETLEALARTLFKSWFVDATTNNLPKGWRAGTVGDLGDIICGKTPPTSDPANYGTDVPFVTIPDMHGEVFVTQTGKSLSQLGADTQPGKTLPPYSICVSCIASPGLVILTSQPCQTNQQINSVVPNTGYPPFYCYFALRELSDEIRSRGSGGSVTANLNKGDFAKIPISLPPAELSSRFEETTEPIFKTILVNEHESRTLAALRDALLPKLLSGELRAPPASTLKEATV